MHTRSTIPEPPSSTCFPQAVRLTGPQRGFPLPSLNNLLQSLVFEGLPGALSSRPFCLSGPCHLTGCRQYRGCCMGSTGAEAPCAAGRQPRRAGRRQSTPRAVTGVERSTGSHFLLFLVFFPGGRKAFRSRSKTTKVVNIFLPPLCLPWCWALFSFLSGHHQYVPFSNQNFKRNHFCFHPDPLSGKTLCPYTEGQIFLHHLTRETERV